MTIARTLLRRGGSWALAITLLGVLAMGACTSPVALQDSAIVAAHTTSSGNHTTSSGNVSKSER